MDKNHTNKEWFISIDSVIDCLHNQFSSCKAIQFSQLNSHHSAGQCTAKQLKILKNRAWYTEIFRIMNHWINTFKASSICLFWRVFCFLYFLLIIDVEILDNKISNPGLIDFIDVDDGCWWLNVVYFIEEVNNTGGGSPYRMVRWLKSHRRRHVSREVICMRNRNSKKILPFRIF